MNSKAGTSWWDMGVSQEHRTCSRRTAECGQCHWTNGSQDLGVTQLHLTILLMHSHSEEPHVSSHLLSLCRCDLYICSILRFCENLRIS